MYSATSKLGNADGLEASIDSATQGLLSDRQADGHWVYELEADCTIPAEYVLLAHYLAEPADTALEAKIPNYLRRVQGAHGGWPLVHDGEFDMSASVKAYFALKMIGDSIDAPHMVRAREAIHARGGAAKSNVFTRFMLALFGVTTWRSVPVLPVEITLLPLWFPFHLNKISYWARTTLVPLLVLAALKPRAKNPKGVRIHELFLQDPRSIGMTAKAPHQSWGWFLFFRILDSVLRVVEPLFPKRLRARAIDAAVAFIEERLNGEDGGGGGGLFFPADGQRRDDVRSARQGRGLSAARDAAAGARQASGDWRGRSLLPAVRLTGVGHRARLPRHARSRKRGRAGASAARAGLAGAQTGAGSEGGLGGQKSGYPPGGMGISIQQRPLSRPRRYRRRRHGHGSRPARGAESGLRRRHRSWPRMDRGHAEQGWRVGRLRRQQPRILPQQHPVLGPRRLAGPADRGRHGALYFHAGPAWGDRQYEPRSRGRGRLPEEDPAYGGVLVRPLGP